MPSARIGSSRVGASLVTLRCLLSVALSARCRFSHHITTATAATLYLIRSSASFRPSLPTSYSTLVAYIAPLLPPPSTANPSHSLFTIDTRPILQPIAAHSLASLDNRPILQAIRHLPCRPSLTLASRLQSLSRLPRRVLPQPPPSSPAPRSTSPPPVE